MLLASLVAIPSIRSYGAVVKRVYPAGGHTLDDREHLYTDDHLKIRYLHFVTWHAIHSALPATCTRIPRLHGRFCRLLTRVHSADAGCD